MNQSKHLIKSLTITHYLALLVLILLWEGWLAPAPNAPPGLWLMLKALPLLLPLRGLFRGKPKTYLLTTLLLMFYFCDGVVLTYLHWSDGFAFDSALPYAIAEWVIAVNCFALALIYIKQAAQPARG